MNGSPGRRSPVRAILAAVLLGAVLAGSASLATRLSGPRELVAVPAGGGLTLLHGDAGGDRAPTPAATGPASTTGSAVAPTTGTAVPPTTTSAPPPVTTAPVTTTTAPSYAPASSAATQVVALVNQARVQAGCHPLRADPRLDTAAQQHSTDMSERHYFSHTTPAGVTFGQREKQAGYPSPGGENIAEGYPSAQQVMTGWMNSSGHRANILNCSYTTIGVGLDSDGWYWTQDFGR